LIDEFTIIEQGRELLTMEADAARDRFRKIRARFAQLPAQLDFPGALNVKQNGRELEVLADGNSEQLLEKLKSHSPEDLRCESLSLEEIFVVSGVFEKNQRWKTMNKIPFNAETRRTRRSAEMSRVIWIFCAIGNLFPLREPLGSAGFQTCCIADCPVGRTSGSCASKRV